jgi:antitoxin component of MazEF toxin-antitoxin module
LDRKIVKVGNSLGVIIPSVFLEEMEIGHQDHVEIEYSKELKTITIKSKETIPEDNYLEQVVKGIVDKYLQDKGL